MIILMGLAGSGKSTQGKMLAEETGRVWLSAGQVLRETGQFDEIMKQGVLVDDMLTVKLMAQKMAEVVRSGRDAILDGFPRDVEQAEWIAENIAPVIKLIVQINVPKEELLRRLELRGRADDLDRGAIEKRFQIVEQNVYAVCEILKQKGVVVRGIDGTGTPDEVYQRLKGVVLEVEKAESMEMTDVDGDGEAENE